MNSFYVGRKIRKSNFDQDQSVFEKNSISVVPIYINSLQQNFNEITFSVCLNMLFHYKESVGNNISPLANPYLLQIKEIFVKNIDFINNTQTIFSTLRKFRRMAINIEDECFEKIGNRIVSVFENSNYKFNDNGSAISLTIKTLQKYGNFPLEIYKKLNQILINNTEKIYIFLLVACFDQLGRENGVLTKNNIFSYLDVIVHRKCFLTSKNITKVFYGILNYSKREKASLEQDLEHTKRLFNTIKELVSVLGQNIKDPLPEEYLYVLLAVIKVKEFENLLLDFKNKFNLGSEYWNIQELWQEYSKDFSFIASEQLMHATYLIDILNYFNIFHNIEEYMNIEQKTNFIKALILLLDIRYSEFLKKEIFHVIITFLQMEKIFLQQNNIFCQVRNIAYKSFTNLASDKTGFPFLLLENKEEIEKRDLLYQNYYRGLKLGTQNEFEEEHSMKEFLINI